MDGEKRIRQAIIKFLFAFYLVGVFCLFVSFFLDS